MFSRQNVGQFKIEWFPRRKIFHLESDTRFTFDNMTSGDPCPDSHFECPESTHCLPVYLRCNGLYQNLKCDHGEHFTDKILEGQYSMMVSAVYTLKKKSDIKSSAMFGGVIDADKWTDLCNS